MSGVDLRRRISSSVKTLIAHLGFVAVMTVLGLVLFTILESSEGVSSYGRYAGYALSRIAHSLADTNYEEVYLVAAYASALGLISFLTCTHPFCHALTGWIVFFLIAPYHFSDHEVRWAFYTAFIAPWVGIGSLCAWLISRRFWRPAA